MLKYIETRKTIALFLTLAFGILSVYGFVVGKTQFAEVTPIVTMVIGYYFGKSTALDNPKKEGMNNE